MAERASTPVLRWWGRVGASVAMVAAVTAVIALVEQEHAPPLSFLSLYLLIILPVAVLWGTVLASVISVLSVGVYAFLFIPPRYRFEVADSHSLVELAVFLVTAVVVGQLTARLRRAALAAERLTEEQSALRRVATLVARSGSPPEVFEAITREVGLLCGADLARMERYEADGTVSFVAAWSQVAADLDVGIRLELDGPSIARSVRQTGDAARMTSFADAPGAIAREARALGIRSSVGCPIVVAGRLWGVIAASTRSDRPFPADTERQIGGFTELVATAIENAEARAELAVSLALQLRAARALVPPELDELGAELEGIAAGLSDALDELREMARGIHPAILSEGGLAPALRALSRRSPIPVDVAVPADRALPERIEVSAYYVVSEALTNAVKHAQASAISVAVEASDGVLRISVKDDGVGGADFSRGTGLAGLKDRVEALGGRILLESLPAAGTTLRAELPLSGDH
jgi:K+-sensing histidine kinase KdpD